jgi:hypothetical protein
MKELTKAIATGLSIEGGIEDVLEEAARRLKVPTAGKSLLQRALTISSILYGQIASTPPRVFATPKAAILGLESVMARSAP